MKFPHRGEVWDYYVDRKKQEFVPWAESVQAISYNSATTPMGTVTVPTGETASINFWMDNLMTRSHGAMLIGPAGVGKTAIIMGKLRSLVEKGDDNMARAQDSNRRPLPRTPPASLTFASASHARSFA